ncbi:MAG: amidohydrolase [Deltaproteobacteria bacterium]|nr:amidohydrolase [Deltaproteobacteria bacterium]
MTPNSAILTPNDTLDYLIHDGLLLPLSPDFPEAIRGSLGIQGEKIVFIQPQGSKTLLPPARKIIDAQGLLVMPGLINTHTHGAMTLFRGLADDLPLQTWLEEFIFPAEKRFVTPETVYWGTLLACAEMIMSGTTTFADGYFYMDEAVKAVDRSGMRSLICQGVLDFPVPGVADPSRNVAVAGRFVETWKDFSPLIQTGIFCHSPYTCSPQTLQRVKSICRKQQVPFFIHGAETREEVSLIRSRYGKTPVRHLNDLDLLDEKSVIVHAVQVDSEEIDWLSRKRSAVAHCPESNMKLAAGIAPVKEMLEKGLRVGLGTDGCASNNDLDLLKEMDMAAKLEKVHYLDPTVMNDRTVLRMATTEGAKVLGLGNRVGSLEAGKQADLIFLDLAKPHLIPCYDPFSIIVYSAQGSDVHSVMIAGRMIMENRRILTFDLEEVLERVNRIAQRIVSR